MSDALLVTSSFIPGRGGIESFLADLCSTLSPRLAVLAPAQRDGIPLPSDLAYPTIPGRSALLWPGRRALKDVLDAAAGQGTDRVVFGTPWPLILLGPHLARRGLRYASFVHGAELLVPAAVPLLRRRLASALATADLLLPVSGFTEAKLRGLLADAGRPPPEMHRSPPNLDLDRFHPGVDTTEVVSRLGLTGRKVLLFFGRMVARKGVHRLVSALPHIRARVPEAILVVAGTGPQERRLKRMARRTEGVLFAGRVSDADAPALYRAAHVFALPVADRYRGLDTEGLGMVVLEAAASGVPCVAGRSGGSPETVVDGVTGFVVDATNEQELVERLVWILEHEPEALEMGRAGRDHVAERFSGLTPPEPLLEWLG